MTDHAHAQPAHTGARWLLADSVVLVGRSLRHAVRNFDSLLLGIVLPVMLLLLFVYVFGGAIETGTSYLNYVVPGIILLCAGYGAATTAVSVNQDMTTGLIDRFRSLPIRGHTVLTGHVVASLTRNLFSTLLVVGVALIMGFRPTTDPLALLAALGVVALYVLTLSWLSVVFGLIASSPEGAGGFSFFILFLPYLSSAFVPVDTMAPLLRGVAEHQPITPVIETLRALLMGTPASGDLWLALAWCGGLLVVSISVAATLFRRKVTT